MEFCAEAIRANAISSAPTVPPTAAPQQLPAFLGHAVLANAEDAREEAAGVGVAVGYSYDGTGAGSYDYDGEGDVASAAAAAPCARESVPPVAGVSAVGKNVDAPAFDSLMETMSGDLDSPLVPGPVLRGPLSFADFKAAVLKFVDSCGPVFRAELRLIEVAKSRDLSTADCDALIKTMTDPTFVSLAYGAGAHVYLPTTWHSVSNHARDFLLALRDFIPLVAVRSCEVRTGPERDAHVHGGRVAFLQAGAWRFMLLDYELFAPAVLVRPVASAGASRVLLHPSWADHVGDGGAGHPSFAAHTLAREATILAANVHATLRTVPMGMFMSIDGTRAGNTAGRMTLTAVYARCAWLPYARLHDERAYTVIALMQIRKLSTSASNDKSAAPVLRAALMQELLRVSVCCERTLEPFEAVLPGEHEAVWIVPYIVGFVLDWGEVVMVGGCGGGGKGCTMCLCRYGKLGEPVIAGFCAGGGVFRNGADTAAWAAQKIASGAAFAAISPAEEKRFRVKPVKVR